MLTGMASVLIQTGLCCKNPAQSDGSDPPFYMNSDFSPSAPAANPVFYRTYSRKNSGDRESWKAVIARTVEGIAILGNLSASETELIRQMQSEQKLFPSGRWLWVGGTDWINDPSNYSGAYNCTSTNLVDWEAFGLMMDLAMMGSGTGAVLEQKYIEQLPTIRNLLRVVDINDPGGVSEGQRKELTVVSIKENKLSIVVGDSRQGWVGAYQAFLECSSNEDFDPFKSIEVSVDLSNVRPPGEKLKGFGGTSNPVKLKELFIRLAQILNRAQGRKLTSVECCLLIDEAASVVVAGNIRRSAGMRQFSADDYAASVAKDNLWLQDSEGHWSIDPERDALRMANHTRVFHTKPDRHTVLEAVTKQYYSGEGAIQFAPEAIARSNADILATQTQRNQFVELYCEDVEIASAYLWMQKPDMPYEELLHRMSRYGLNPCGEILGSNFHCNLAEVHLNRIDPTDIHAQTEAFRAAGLAVAALLNHRFLVERYRTSRDMDPIVGVSFTGLFDFFVNSFGTAWLKWWEAGRPSTDEGKVFRAAEQAYLVQWRNVVESTVREYCERHGLRVPNRCTTVQPAGTKSLLTGASSGWHPPKSARFIRRITFRKDDPVALACLEYGYNIVPSQSDKDEQGRLLDNPFDPRCTEWLVEIPTAVSWAEIEGADSVDLSKFSALAQFDFYMQVQKYYTAHNTSATIEFREEEIESLADAIYQAIQANEGYISAALLARFDANATFPRLPFEPITVERFDELHSQVLQRRKSDDFFVALQKYDTADLVEAGPVGCDSDKCLLPLTKS
jgi:ribonucleotide reductase class II